MIFLQWMVYWKSFVSVFAAGEAEGLGGNFINCSSFLIINVQCGKQKRQQFIGS
jgi:hypothetical protein